MVHVLCTVTFEDKRQENFMKGQAELERRRELLRAEQKKMEEERLAHERAEFEKRERIRQVINVNCITCSDSFACYSCGITDVFL